MTGKTKNSIAVAGFIIALILCYTLAFSGTLAQRKQYRALKKGMQLAKDLPAQLALLTEKERYYDSLQRTFRITETSFQNSLLKTVNGVATDYGFRVITFEEPHVFETPALRKNSYAFTVEGSFMSILTLTHHLEQKTRFGEIIHCHLEKKKDRKTRKEQLQARIVLQNIR